MAFPVGEIVEYYSSSLDSWILARVLAHRPDGLYDLDCKPAVDAQRIRRRGETCSKLQSLHVEASGLQSTRFTANGSPLQLVRVRRQCNSTWKFEINDEAARVLESYGSQPLAVCAACGPARTGKSFLLNSLLGATSFCVGATSRPCTEGIWMQMAGLSERDLESEAILFLDCEGFGHTDVDRSRDSRLMALCIALSSVFVLNTRGVLSEGLFNSLALVAQLADRLFQDLDLNAGALADAATLDGERPALLWVLRDFVLELRSAAGAEISADEYLEGSLQARPLEEKDGFRGASSSVAWERSRAGVEVRETLKRSFPHRKCATLVQPVAEEEQLTKLSMAGALRPAFQAQLTNLNRDLAKIIEAHPKRIAGQRVGAAAFVAMLRVLVDALNSDRALDVRGAWDNVQHSACQSLLEELLAGVRADFGQIASGVASFPGPAGPLRLPVGDELLAEVLARRREEVQKEWRQRAVGDESVRGDYWRELRDCLTCEEEFVMRENDRLAERQLQDAAARQIAFRACGRGGTAEFSAEVLKLLDQEAGLPAKPALRAVREALEGARRDCLRCGEEVAEKDRTIAELEKKLAEALRRGASSSSLSQRSKPARDKTKRREVESVGTAGGTRITCGLATLIRRRLRRSADTACA
eukprot:TRINITY_DN25875_c0_g1_i1.p1 TRINITY_DN25875_c0_g1~~TRINITY_DN25875_c0_g1_i1.p1  ORF type:complete len:663 (-),score=114.34 TRINITY_DN25875_c0_g1_i1:72-2003(-)